MSTDKYDFIVLELATYLNVPPREVLDCVKRSIPPGDTDKRNGIVEFLSTEVVVSGNPSDLISFDDISKRYKKWCAETLHEQCSRNGFSRYVLDFYPGVITKCRTRVNGIQITVFKGVTSK